MTNSFFEDKADAFLFKFCMAFLFVSVLLFSLFQLGFAFQTWSLKFENSFAIVSFVFLSILLRKKTPGSVVEKRAELDVLSPLMGLNFQEKGLTFLRGLLDGLLHGSRKPFQP